MSKTNVLGLIAFLLLLVFLASENVRLHNLVKETSEWLAICDIELMHTKEVAEFANTQLNECTGTY
jgi:hypothetical protein